MTFKGQATQEQLDRIAELRHKKIIPLNISGDPFSDYIGKYTAECIIKELENADDDEEKYSKPEYKKIEKGTEINHKMFGIGKVIECKKEIATIDFNGNIKKIHINYI